MSGNLPACACTTRLDYTDKRSEVSQDFSILTTDIQKLNIVTQQVLKTVPQTPTQQEFPVSHLGIFHHTQSQGPTPYKVADSCLTGSMDCVLAIHALHTI